eukprot:TRINITY_DN7043_c1_g1_i1.p1 TRINITY_DN7043_c1_g1~~TRINITY_DN7043_c1_g1_i1.p1  ORF type:complete len:816 (+),score=196.54 TRINITY_DN7043_c1_g1_i1:316-2763(+)
MEVPDPRDFPHDQRRDCQTFSNNLYPSSQSRKISIGITVDASAKPRPDEPRKEDEVMLPVREKKVAYSQGKSVEANAVGTKAASKVKQVNHETAALFSAQTLRSETATTKTVEFFANRTSVLQSDDFVHKEFNSIAYGRKSEKGGNSERVEEFTFAARQGTHVSDKGGGGEKIGNISTGNEALRMKLWEILGTSPSRKDQTSNLHPHETDTGNLKLGCKEVRKDETNKHNQNSDSIETDSESPNQSVRRPVTRSLTQRKAQTRKQSKLQCKNNNGVKVLPSSSPRFKLKHQEKNIFAFDETEGRTGTSRWPVKSTSSLSKRKTSEKSKRIHPRRIHFSRSMNSENSSHSSGRETSPPPLPEKTAVTAQQRNSKAGSHSSPSLNHKDGFHHSTEKRNTDKQKDFDRLPSSKSADMKKCFSCPSVPNEAELHGDFDGPLSPNNAGSKEKCESSLSPNNNRAPDDIQSPTFAMNSPMENEFRNPPSLRKRPEGEGFHSLPMERFGCLRNFRASTLGSAGSSLCSGSSSDDKESNQSDDRESKDSSIRSLYKEEDDVEKRLSLSSLALQDHESSEEDELIEEGSGAGKNWIPGSGCSKKPPFMLRRNKRLCSQEGVELSEPDPMSPSPKGTEESNGFKEASEQAQENGLARAVAQFALVLENFKTKMKSQTRQKSSEILTSAADRINLHLRSIESQIQTDVEKFTSLRKSKRKRLESRFQEQQKRLKFMHSKFKEEINHHLQECKSTLEELEAYETELKGNAERQKASQRKLLLQAEEEIEIHLGDAERSIASYHKVAKKKMQELKYVLSECLSEGLLS